jgi:hypothetical protein
MIMRIQNFIEKYFIDIMKFLTCPLKSGERLRGTVLIHAARGPLQPTSSNGYQPIQLDETNPSVQKSTLDRACERRNQCQTEETGSRPSSLPSPM